MDILTTVNAGYAGLKFAKETLQVLLGYKIEGEVRAAVVDALTKLGSTQDTLFALREELFSLQTENNRLRQDLKTRDDWEARKSQYSLTQAAGGAIVYQSSVASHHFACPACFETNREVQILQDRHVASGRYDCPRCKEHYDVGVRRSFPIERAATSGDAWDNDR